ncbi:MAG: DUF2207 domain-containing protein [Coriobacteriales bacterium]|jgi:hypothetical protein|nr:DUF2207 domain-containing protein [Coriobacteriales bacterium]
MVDRKTEIGDLPSELEEASPALDDLPSELTETPFEKLRDSHPAVLSATLLGKTLVSANEYIATLMALYAQGILAPVEDEEGNPIGLRLTDSAVRQQSDPIDSAALDLLFSYFAEEDGVVYLSTAKELGNQSKAIVDTQYPAWKELVKAETAGRVTVDQRRSLFAKVALGLGYVLITLAVLSTFILSIPASVPFAVGGIVCIGGGVLLRYNIPSEKRGIRELRTWLEQLKTHVEELPDDSRSIRQILAFACAFSLATKVADVLDKARAEGALPEDILNRPLAELVFWKDLRRELYTNSED